MNVLVVEDDRVAARAIEQLMKREKIKTSICSSINCALHYLANHHPPTFVLLDLMLPDGFGTEVQEFIHKYEIATQVIVMTGCDSALIEVSSAMVPMCLLRKPVDFNELLMHTTGRPVYAGRDESR